MVCQTSQVIIIRTTTLYIYPEPYKYQYDKTQNHYLHQRFKRSKIRLAFQVSFWQKITSFSLPLSPQKHIYVILYQEIIYIR